MPTPSHGNILGRLTYTEADTSVSSLVSLPELAEFKLAHVCLPMLKAPL